MGTEIKVNECGCSHAEGNGRHQDGNSALHPLILSVVAAGIFHARMVGRHIDAVAAAGGVTAKLAVQVSERTAQLAVSAGR